MTANLLRILGLATVLLICQFYPFLPGRYDPLAVHLSKWVQLIGAGGIVWGPVAAFWLAYEFKKNGESHSRTAYFWALAALILTSVVVLLSALAILLGGTKALGFAILAVWFWAIKNLIPKVRRLKTDASGKFHPAPVYLIFIPLVLVVSQWFFAKNITNLSRERAIAHSREIIAVIENYRAQQGRYPFSLHSLWKDYSPSVVGIDRFHYAPDGESYNLSFEQPRFLFDDFGVREFVVYHPLDQHFIPSHDSWVLLLSPQQVNATQGWFRSVEAGHPHWKLFWFD